MQALPRFNEHGLITAIDPSGVIPSIDLPPATTTQSVRVSVPARVGYLFTGAGYTEHCQQRLSRQLEAYAGSPMTAHGHDHQFQR